MGFLKKAENNLQAAKICYDNGLIDAAVNRAYYATFHAAVEALGRVGIKKEKLDHKWVQAQFSQQLINRRKLFPGKFRPVLVEMQIVRNKADYEPVSVSKKAAQEQISRAEEMVKFISMEISS